MVLSPLFLLSSDNHFQETSYYSLKIKYYERLKVTSGVETYLKFNKSIPIDIPKIKPKEIIKNPINKNISYTIINRKKRL